MPANKVASKTTTTEAPTVPSPPKTVNERSWQRYHATNPYSAHVEKVGLGALTPAELAGYSHAHFARSPSFRARCDNQKALKDAWRYVNEHNLPARSLKKPLPGQWGRDATGKDVGEYTLVDHEARAEKQDDLQLLLLASDEFKDRRGQARSGCYRDRRTGETVVIHADEVEEEKRRRARIAQLRNDLYRQKMGSYAQDPDWDDVTPIPQEEPEGALATIAYSDDYAEAVSYLRAVMVQKEYSQRCLRLTEHIISMNPAHYTVWLYRASVVFALKIPILDEMAWLNGVALEYLKNYQIWHHRHLLAEEHYTAIAKDAVAVASFAAAERDFLDRMLNEDGKNYHVWSYRTWLVGKFGLHGDADELAATAGIIDMDPRNNSAWSHRFFLVFSNPAYATPGLAATEPDPALPAIVVDSEERYAQDQARRAPQNQSAWNYLRAVLVKGGRPLSTLHDFVCNFVSGLDKGEDVEKVTSSYALDLLAEIFVENGDVIKADLCLRRLAERWDPVRAGYWEWRRECLKEKKT